MDSRRSRAHLNGVVQSCSVTMIASEWKWSKWRLQLFHSLYKIEWKFVLRLRVRLFLLICPLQFYFIGTNIQLLLMQILEVSIFFVNQIWTVSLRLPVQTEFKINSNILSRWHKTGNTSTKQVCRRQLNIHMRSTKHNADYVKTYVLLRFRETC